MKFIAYILTLLLILAILATGCKHEAPISPEPGNIVNNNNNNGGGGSGGNGNGNGNNNEIPCDPDTVYFQNTILPLLVSNCSMSGCHNAASAQKGVVLTDYNSVISTGEVNPFDPQDSELYEVLIESDPDKRMPYEKPPLSQQNINLIYAWINQGALNNFCNECDTLNVTYTGTVKPLVELKCKGCHSGSAPSGGWDFTTYTDLNTVALNGKLAGAINHSPGFSPMPKNGQKLSDCDINKIEMWIADGAPNN